MTDHKLENKVAIVTGAASGIGRASALRLAKSGAKVGLIDLKEENADTVKQEIENNGEEAIISDTDVSNPQEVEASIQKVVEKWGRLDFVFVNAGINGRVAPIEDLTPDDWDQTLTTNLKSTFLTAKYAIPHMKESGGSIVITSSINGNRTFTGFGMTAYSSSKAGQMAFGKMAALELAEYRIRVNIICPGAIETNIGENTHPDKQKLKNIEIPVEYPEGSQPLEHGAGSPEQVADLVHFLASNESSHITGTELYIDGAESLLK
ncbi:NAD(P)-dependent dehydrogenase (short-subunit alcohol dehydrogenase family) [Virgibacillus natechei]|uniref:NAD(P)-dependent dehydrogenase (Short-subunit alcohol dehydrogenase family) n=1 Tax=Virgibacillus natechei TaxID=1216297 RepID=A0ABS4IFM3_9BACI|nr:SDR family NAD(P)-dependent oxidoreductase [Virgibacillus natechei]MBP1969266.1 NAD(P)-dependent dehydrogenase (short-subunit alcohol dehydrogenase family) [Virgibacillus natechei]UZD12423.1 SDR family oxidoreductase [Virgibacillus natechei]